VARFIRIAAGYTLSIYLLHFPIEMMIAAILHSQPDGPIKTAAVVMGAVALAGSIGVFIEPQRYWLKTFLWLWFERLSKSMARRWDASAPDPASAARDNKIARRIK
jgi:peptidoglycan/LPS O-acetylase OafA/YrhL